MADEGTSNFTRRAVIVGAAGLVAAAAVPVQAAPAESRIAVHLARIEALLAGPDVLTRDARSLAYAFQHHAAALMALSPADAGFHAHAAEVAECRAWAPRLCSDAARPVLMSAFAALDAYAAVA